MQFVDRLTSRQLRKRATTNLYVD